MVTLNLMTSDIDTVVLDACVSRNAVWVLYVLVKIHVVDDSSFMMSLLANQGGKKDLADSSVTPPRQKRGKNAGPRSWHLHSSANYIP